MWMHSKGKNSDRGSFLNRVLRSLVKKIVYLPCLEGLEEPTNKAQQFKS